MIFSNPELNGWMDQDATRYGGRPLPIQYCVRWRSSSRHGKGHRSPPTFWPMSIVAKRLDGTRIPLGTKVGLSPGNIMLDKDPAPPQREAQQPPPHFLAHFALARSPISATAELLFPFSPLHDCVTGSLCSCLYAMVPVTVSLAIVYIAWQLVSCEILY